jgi:hypothetical protein
VFADDSTQLIDGNSSTVYGNIQATTLRTAETKITLGDNANAGANSVSIGSSAGALTPANNSVSIGIQAGYNTQGAYSVALGSSAGSQSQGASSVAVGSSSGATNQGVGAVAVGMLAGNNYQGANAVAIGYNAGRGTASQQAANTIILNATGSEFNGVSSQTNSFYVNPIRTTANGTPLMYNSTTKEITYSNVLEFVGSTISTSDSSSITVDVLTTFNSDVVVENELTVSNGIKFSDGSVLRSYSPVTVIAATTTAQTVNDAASASYIQFVETVDTAGAYSPGVFTAPYTGYYQVNLSLYFSTTVTLNPGSFFLIDSNPDVVIFSGAWTGSYLHYSTVIPATAGDTIGFVFRQVSGAAIDIASGSRLTIHRVSIGA